MWTKKQRRRYNLLRERQQAGILTDEERVELAEWMQALNDREAASLVPANERKAQEIATLTRTVAQLEAQNHRLRAYLHERQTFLARVQALVAELQAADRQMRERYADVLTLIDASPTHVLKARGIRVTEEDKDLSELYCYPCPTASARGRALGTSSEAVQLPYSEASDSSTMTVSPAFATTVKQVVAFGS